MRLSFHFAIRRNLSKFSSIISAKKRAMLGSETHKKTAGIIVIGDEILYGHTIDANSGFLCKQLHSLGVRVMRITTIPDCIPTIADEVTSFSGKYDFVLTSGGIGPTHDDVTYAAVARAFGVKLEANVELIELLRKFAKTVEEQKETGDLCHHPLFKMACVPADAKLNYPPTNQLKGYPVVSSKNVYILPGVPHYMKKGFEAIKDLLKDEQHPFYMAELRVETPESAIVPILDEAVNRYDASVHFGSYPDRTTVLIRMESDEAGAAEAASLFLKNKLTESNVKIVNSQERQDPISESFDITVQRVYEVLDPGSASCDASLIEPVTRSLELLEQGLSQYGPENVCVSFNGGKDCTALLHMTLAVLRRVYPQFTDLLHAFCVRSDNTFEEVDSFVKESVERYGLNLHTYSYPIQTALEQLLKDNPNVKCIVLGTRRTDPNGANLNFFDETDPDWPRCMRLHPVLNWSYADIWTFIRNFGVPYCPLYDSGYTSLGNKINTKRNSALKFTDSKGEINYKPAFSLQDAHVERNGRL